MKDRKMGKIGTMSQSNPVTTHGIFNTNNENRIEDFWESDKKCTMAYCISTEEVFRKMEEK